jgi:putative ABC transport system permease protein
MHVTLREGALVRRALGSGRTRSLIAALGIATSVLLVLVIFATYRSVEVSIDEFIGQPGIDLWVAPKGTDNLVRSAALLPEEVVEDIAAMPGVREAAPILRSFMTADPVRVPGASRRRGLTLLALGFRAPAGLGRPPRLFAGRAPAGPREVALDRAAAHRLGIGLGGRFELNGRTVDVVGLTSRTNLISTQFVFLDAATAGQLSGYGSSASFVAVGLSPGEDRARVAREIEETFPGLSVFGREVFLQRNQEEVFAGFRPIQALGSAIGLLAACILVALLVQGVVEDRRRDIAVLLALGASARVVAGSVVARTMGLVLLGVAAGAVAAQVLSAALNRWVPTLDMVPAIGDVAGVLAAFLLVALVGSLIPVIRLGRTDPAEAFQP